MSKIVGVVVMLITTFFVFNLFNKKDTTIESRGIFVSYIEYMEHFDNKSNNEIIKEIETMVNNIEKYHFNTIYLHVRPFSDSTYDSDIFPFSHTISGKQGEYKLDTLKYFIELAHKKNIKIHAWINPYRISNQTDISIISSSNPAYKWLNTNKVKVVEESGIYYNPANYEVIELITDGVYEVISKYDVDGIIFDDYFYPDDESIDSEEYNLVKDNISLTDFRLNKVNQLISKTYKIIKEYNPKIQFGVSPDGNIYNNYNIHYADVKRWLSEENYIDYIIPQIYYGFYHETKPYIKTLVEWNNLIANDTKLVVALALYKSGEIDNYAKSGSREWIENSNLIKKQIQVSRNASKYAGYTIFRYDYLFETDKSVNLQSENTEYLSLFE